MVLLLQSLWFLFSLLHLRPLLQSTLRPPLQPPLRSQLQSPLPLRYPSKTTSAPIQTLSSRETTAKLSLKCEHSSRRTHKSQTVRLYNNARPTITTEFLCATSRVSRMQILYSRIMGKSVRKIIGSCPPAFQTRILSWPIV